MYVGLVPSVMSGLVAFKAALVNVDTFLSIMYCCLALSICLRLATQALARDVSRAWTKFGMAMASRMPMIRTTIMISTRVKPADFLLRNAFMKKLLFLSAAGPVVYVSSGRLIELTVFSIGCCGPAL